jgi:predicted DNA-binding protein
VRAYEAVFSTVLAIQSQFCDDVKLHVDDILEQCQLSSILPIELQEGMQELKCTMSRLRSQARSYKEALEALLESDEDLALMNLSLLRDAPHLYTLPLSEEILRTHDYMEIILESYLVDFTSLEAKLEDLSNQLNR